LSSPPRPLPVFFFFFLLDGCDGNADDVAIGSWTGELGGAGNAEAVTVDCVICAGAFDPKFLRAYKFVIVSFNSSAG
jgi:hypothetical protein